VLGSTYVAGTTTEPAAFAKRTDKPLVRAKPAPVSVSVTPPSRTPTVGDKLVNTGGAVVVCVQVESPFRGGVQHQCQRKQRQGRVRRACGLYAWSFPIRTSARLGAHAVLACTGSNDKEGDEQAATHGGKLHVLTDGQ